MGRLSVSTRKRVIVLWQSGNSLPDIQRRLKEEEVEVSLRSLQRLRQKFQRFHTIKDLARATRPRILTDRMMNTIEESLQGNDELTARRLKAKLDDRFVDLPDVSLSTIKCRRKELGWVCTRPHYCQLIREANKLKRKEWCQVQLDKNEKFENVVFTDECTYAFVKRRNNVYWSNAQNMLLRCISGVAYRWGEQRDWSCSQE